VDLRTVKEQLLYEIHDPAAYLTPDVVADLGEVELQPLGPDRVQVSGVRGHPRPDAEDHRLLRGRLAGRGRDLYAGPNAVARARLAAELVRSRLAEQAPALQPLRCDLIGVASLFADDAGAWAAARSGLGPQDGALQDVRLRVAARAGQRAEAELLTREVLALYTCGPAGGGVRSAITRAWPANRGSCPGPGSGKLEPAVTQSAPPQRPRPAHRRSAHPDHDARAHRHRAPGPPGPGRTGDKGNTSSISVIAYEPRHWPLLVEQVTEARVAELFASRHPDAGHEVPAAQIAGHELRAA
jgi:hypothetical protein